ncbi:hypothetical protein [Aeromonas salmonicida]|uniref:hypothetical protein n=1 Tax=Aeromonas salmonicida TaxID=645 RepID=UPI0012F8A662|nr:hypothetical protein [Aeromonas salmonicida]
MKQITGTGSGCPGAAGIRLLAALVRQITGTGSGCPGAAGIRPLAALVWEKNILLIIDNRYILFSSSRMWVGVGMT